MSAKSCYICGNVNSPKRLELMFLVCKSRRKCIRRFKRSHKYQWMHKHLNFNVRR